MSEVSVIVPVFNVVRYLRAALDSLAAQTFGDWEAICVDDGSDDGSGSVLDEYAARDPRFRVMHRKNGGVSAARNAGLETACGKTILFFDPDDTVESDWIEKCVESLDGVDLGWGGAKSFVNGEERSEVPFDVGAVYEGDDVRTRVWKSVFGYGLCDLPKMLLPGGMWKACHREFGSVCWRAFRRDVIGELRFDEKLRLYEDSVFLSAYALKAKSMRVTGDTGYRYHIRTDGAMTTESRSRAVEYRFDLRDARRMLDPEMKFWRGSFLLSALSVLVESGSISAFCRYIGNRPNVSLFA